jgi:hypothetical protein
MATCLTALKYKIERQRQQSFFQKKTLVGCWAMVPACLSALWVG